jgi:hypothetical protein
MHSGRSNPGASARKSLFRTPALQALLIQLASFGMVLALATLTEIQLTVAAAALLQGVAAAALAYWRGMARWWLPIQFLFPVLAIVVLAFHLPPWIFLIAFIAFVALYWTTFRTQVPFYPSGRATWEAVDALLPSRRPLRFIDIGSGFGGLVMHLAARHPGSGFTGIEVAPLPWLASMLKARLMRNGARLVRGDYQRLDFADYDVVFAYLSPAAMPALWSKASSEMRSGALLLSYEFPIAGVPPDIVHTPTEGGPALYGWRLP